MGERSYMELYIACARRAREVEKPGKEAMFQFSVVWRKMENYLIIVYYNARQFIISKHPRRGDCVVD